MQPRNANTICILSPRPGPQAEQISGADRPVGWAGLRRFFGFWRGGGMGRKCGLWPHADKTGGFQRGAAAPPWHTTLLARCSVLYLLARLTGEAGCGAVCTPLAPAGKWAGFLRPGGSKKPVRFQRAAAGIQAPVPRPSSPAGLGKSVPKSRPTSARQG